MSRRKRGNLYYRPGKVIPYEWPMTVWRRCIDDVEKYLGRSRQPREIEFMSWLYTMLQRGEIPGPTLLNRVMGLGQRKQNMLSGRYSRIRRIVFEHAGLIAPDIYGRDVSARRYRWPEGPAPKPGQLGWDGEDYA